MSWFDLRNNSPDPNAALLRSLIQAKIDDEIQAHEPEDSEHLEQGVDTYSTMNISDTLSWSFLRSVSLGSSARNYVPNEPDLDKLRLWIKSENGGHVLKDHAKMGNIINIMGHKPPTLIKIGDQDGLTGNRLCNIMDGNMQFNPSITPGGQFLRISDNPNIRIKELLSTDSITFFIRLLPISQPANDYQVLFSKIDNEQATDGYVGLADRAGYLYFIVRKNNKERVIRTPTPIWTMVIDKAEFDLLYFQEAYFKTKATGVYVLPQPVPFIDFAITCKFSDMSMSIIQNGVEVATTAIHESGLVAHWKLNEGGNIGTTTLEQTPTQRTAYNSAITAGATNGTITNASWVTLPDIPHQSYLRFDGGGDKVLINSYTAIQNLSEITVSFWYRHGGVGTIWRGLLWKGPQDGPNTWLFYIDGVVRFTTWNNSSTRRDATFTPSPPLVAGKWYHFVGRYKISTGEQSITVDNVKASNNGLTGTMNTGSGTQVNIGRGWSDTNFAVGEIYDVQIWNRQLSDAEVTSIYNQGLMHPSFPAWKADPPLPDESPDPITNPFSRYYNVVWSANQAPTKLHARVISGFTNFYDTNDDSDIAGSEQNFPYNAIYDVQPSGGGGGGGSPETVYNTSITSGNHLEFEGGISRAGVRFNSGNAHLGKAVTSVTVRYRRDGSPTGNAAVGIRTNSGSFIQLGTFSVSSGSGEQSATINASSNSYGMQANDIVSVEYPSGSPTIELTYSSSGVSGFTSVEYDGSWGTFNDGGLTNIAMTIQVTAGGGGSTGGYTILKPWNEDRAPFSPMINSRVGAALSGSPSWAAGKKITKVVVQMTRVGSPGGTITCKIFKGGSLTSPVQIGTSKSAGDIPTSQGNVTFEWATEAERIAQGYGLASGDVIGIEVSGGSSSSSNYYIVHHRDTSTVANVWAKYYNTVSPSTGWQYTIYTGGSSSTNTANEVIGQFYDGGFNLTLPAVFAHIKLNHLTTRAAEHFAPSSAGIGKAITKISPRFKKFGSPTGSVSVVIRNSAGTQMTSFGTIDAVADIPVGDVWTQKDFTNLANVRTCASGDRVSVEYGAGDANNYVMVSMNLNHDNFDASLSYAQQWLAAGSSYTNPGTSPGTTTYDIAGTMATGGIATDPDGRTRVGQRCNSPTSVMRGKKVTRVIVALHKIGTPPPDTHVMIRVRKEGTDAIAAEVGQKLASSLATTPTWYTVENVNNVYVTQQNDIVTAEYDHGDDSNYVVLTRTSLDVFETTGNLSQAVDYNAPNYNALTSDLFGEFWTGGDTYTPAVDEQVIRDPFYHHDLLIGAGGHDWSYYAAVGTILNHAGIHLMPEFRIYRRELTVAQALNLYSNRCTITNLALSEVAKVGTFGIAENPP